MVSPADATAASCGTCGRAYTHHHFHGSGWCAECARYTDPALGGPLHYAANGRVGGAACGPMPSNARHEGWVSRWDKAPDRCPKCIAALECERCGGSGIISPTPGDDPMDRDAWTCPRCEGSGRA